MFAKLHFCLQNQFHTFKHKPSAQTFKVMRNFTEFFKTLTCIVYIYKSHSKLFNKIMLVVVSL